MLKIFIDKGHGGFDPGAIGNGVHEADLVDFIGSSLYTELVKYDDVEIKIGPRPASRTAIGRLGPRAMAANEWGADVFISLHINAGGASGHEVLYGRNASKASISLAKELNDAIRDAYKDKGVPDRGTKQQSVYVLNHTNMPSVLCEFGFIDNIKDATLLKDGNFRKAIAAALAKKIASVYGLELKAGKPTVVAEVPKRTEINIVWNGKKLSSKGFNEGGQTYLPTRVLAELSGHKVDFRNKKVFIDGEVVEDVIIERNISYARVIDVCTLIEYTYAWDNKSKTISLFAKKKAFALTGPDDENASSKESSFDENVDAIGADSDPDGDLEKQ